MGEAFDRIVWIVRRRGVFVLLVASCTVDSKGATGRKTTGWKEAVGSGAEQDGKREAE